MTATLDQFRPTVETLQAIKRQIADAGVSLESIPNDWAEVIIAATAKWIATTPDGVASVAKLLNLECFPGSDDKEYIYYPDVGPRELPVKPENILFLKGIVIDGMPAFTSLLDIKQKKEESCEDCGIISFCTKVILEPAAGRHLMRLCNFCISHHSHPRVYDQGNKEDCKRCPKTTCAHNEKNSLKLELPRRYSI